MWVLVNTTSTIPIILEVDLDDLQADVAAAKDGTGDLIKIYNEQSMGAIRVNLLEIVFMREYDPE